MYECKHGTILYGECMQCEREKNTDERNRTNKLQWMRLTSGSIDGWFGLTSKEVAEVNNLSKLQLQQTTQRQLDRYSFLVRKTLRLYMESLKESKREKNTDISELAESSCHVKPPLGLTPKSINDTKRLREIQGAFSRYYNAEMKIPLEWIEEYNSLIDKIKQ